MTSNIENGIFLAKFGFYYTLHHLYGFSKTFTTSNRKDPLTWSVRITNQPEGRSLRITTSSIKTVQGAGKMRQVIGNRCSNVQRIKNGKFIVQVLFSTPFAQVSRTQICNLLSHYACGTFDQRRPRNIAVEKNVLIL